MKQFPEAEGRSRTEIMSTEAPGGIMALAVIRVNLPS